MSETTYDPHRSCQHKVYKMTCAEFDALYDHRDGRCHICLTPASEGRRLVIDHAREYDLRAVRGLLCDKCNALMRRVDNRERYDQRAADYMQGHAPKGQGRRYGPNTIPALAAQLAKFPRFDVG